MTRAEARLRNLQLAVVVAVVAVMMVQVAIDKIVDMVTVRYGLVPAIRAMNVLFVMRRAIMGRRALVGIGRAHFYSMIVNLTSMLMVQVSVMQVIRVAVMLYGGMAAVRPMLMGLRSRMLSMRFRHDLLLSWRFLGATLDAWIDISLDSDFAVPTQ